MSAAIAIVLIAATVCCSPGCAYLSAYQQQREIYSEIQKYENAEKDGEKP